MAAWQDGAAPAAREEEAAAARMEKAQGAWDAAIAVIDDARKKQMAAPGLQEPAKKALATLDREWGGLIAHRDYPMVVAGAAVVGGVVVAGAAVVVGAVVVVAGAAVVVGGGVVG